MWAVNRERGMMFKDKEGGFKVVKECISSY